MNNDNLVRCRRKNKHLSKQIAKKFKQAQKIRGKKSKHYKGKSVPKNSLKRLSKQAQCIDYDEVYLHQDCDEYFYESCDETQFGKFEMKILFHCHLGAIYTLPKPCPCGCMVTFFPIDSYDENIESEYFARVYIQQMPRRQQMYLRQKIENVSLRIDNNINEDNNHSNNNYKSNNDIKNDLKSISIQYKEEKSDDTGKKNDFFYSYATEETSRDYYYAKKRCQWDWKDNFTPMEKNEESTSQPINRTGVCEIENLMVHHLSLYMTRKKNVDCDKSPTDYNRRIDYLPSGQTLEEELKNDLFDHKCRISSFDINDINQALDDWMDEMYKQLNFGGKTLSCGVYSSIIMEYMCIMKDHCPKDMCFIELTISSKMRYKLWYEIKTMQIDFDVDDCDNNCGKKKIEMVRQSFNKRVFDDKNNSSEIKKKIDMIVERDDFYRINELIFEIKWIIDYIENESIKNKANVLKYVEKQRIINHVAERFGRNSLWLSPIQQ